MLTVMIMSGPDDGTLLILPTPKSGEGYIFGRRNDCDVVLPYDSQISRSHARLIESGDGWHLEDLGSRNGTYIGKQKVVDTMPIAPGQMFRMGRTWLRL